MSLFTTASQMKPKPSSSSALFDTTSLYSNEKSPSRMEPMEVDSFRLDAGSSHEETKTNQHLYILPVLLLEFLAIALTRAVLPSLLLEKYDTNVYIVMGFAECARGLLAFISCPLFGKLSDLIGRKLCLLFTVAGTCAPVCSLALLPWDTLGVSNDADMMNITATAAGAQDDAAVMWPVFVSHQSKIRPEAITVFVVLLSLSGIFSSTFTLVFAYISDTVSGRDERVTAYGLAMATLGLSFTIGPMLGGYLAQYNTRYVFALSLILTIVDLAYIYVILPESRELPATVSTKRSTAVSFISNLDQHNVSWNPVETLRIIAVDPFLALVGKVAFLYYTAVWAVVSTLVLYAAKRFALGPERLGELISTLGLSTMVSEAVLVRLIVPMLGEKKSMLVGLAAFGMQCVLLGLAFEGWHLFVCILFAMVGNLVYPSLSSLVCGSVEPDAVGEALGAVNGIKALTEGIGPLAFGTLMTISEDSALPGWPYLLAAVLVYASYTYALMLPDVQQDEYVHELERKKQRSEATRMLDSFASKQQVKRQYDHMLDDDEAEEYLGLLESDSNAGIVSEIDEEEDDRLTTRSEDMSRLPVTFASMMNPRKKP